MGQQHGAGGHVTSSAPTGGLIIDRAVVIHPGMRYVNVTNGETVRFQVGPKSFVRKFSTMLSHGQFNLAEIAPVGVDVGGVVVYCDPDFYERSA